MTVDLNMPIGSLIKKLEDDNERLKAQVAYLSENIEFMSREMPSLAHFLKFIVKESKGEKDKWDVKVSQ